MTTISRSAQTLTPCSPPPPFHTTFHQPSPSMQFVAVVRSLLLWQMLCGFGFYIWRISVNYLIVHNICALCQKLAFNYIFGFATKLICFNYLSVAKVMSMQYLANTLDMPKIKCINFPTNNLSKPAIIFAYFFFVSVYECNILGALPAGDL